MLLGNYVTFSDKAKQNNIISPFCRTCGVEREDIQHILTSHISESRSRILDEISVMCSESVSNINFHHILQEKSSLTQFILDPASMNLVDRIHVNDPLLPEIYKLCRHYCYAADKERLQAIKENLHCI